MYECASHNSQGKFSLIPPGINDNSDRLASMYGLMSVGTIQRPPAGAPGASKRPMFPKHTQAQNRTLATHVPIAMLSQESPSSTP